MSAGIEDMSADIEDMSIPACADAMAAAGVAIGAKARPAMTSIASRRAMNRRKTMGLP
jgi:hypothetical protein